MSYGRNPFEFGRWMPSAPQSTPAPTPTPSSQRFAPYYVGKKLTAGGSALVVDFTNLPGASEIQGRKYALSGTLVNQGPNGVTVTLINRDGGVQVLDSFPSGARYRFDWGVKKITMEIVPVPDTTSSGRGWANVSVEAN